MIENLILKTCQQNYYAKEKWESELIQELLANDNWCLFVKRDNDSLSLYITCRVLYRKHYIIHMTFNINKIEWTLRTKWIELVEFLRRDSSSSNAVICSGSIVGSEITGRALRLRAIQ